jgi:diguanylate cyclase (GGDEF)-like protein
MQQSSFDAATAERNTMATIREGIRAHHPEAQYFQDSSFETFSQRVAHNEVPSIELAIEHVQAANELTEELAFLAKKYLYGAIAIVATCLTLLILALNQLMRTNTRLAKAESELATLAATDGLTNVGNRRKLNQVLNDMHRMRGEARYCIVLVDIDRFKLINDEFGHAKGDEVLIAFATFLNKRNDTSVFRYGGEEFALLIPGATLDRASAIADEVRADVAAAKLCGLPVTASFGVAALREGDAPSTILERADRALYNAKRSGRNRVSSEREAPRSLLPGALPIRLPD